MICNTLNPIKKLPNSFLFFHWIVAEKEKKIIAMVPKYGGKIYQNKKKISIDYEILLHLKTVFGSHIVISLKHL